MILKQKMKFGLLVVSLFILVNAKAQTTQGTIESYAFKNVNVITMNENRGTLYNHTVVVEGDRIKKIVPDSLYVGNLKTKIIDGTNKYMIPGLIDMHAHIIQEFRGAIFADAPQYLLYGVTSIYNLIGRERHLAIRDSIRKGLFNTLDPALENSSFKSLAPDVFTTGWDTNEPHFFTPDEVEATVRKQKELGFDGIKMHAHLSSEAYKRLHETAREVGIKVIGHAPRNLGMDEVFEQKQDLAHGEEYMSAAFSDIETDLFQYSAIFFGIVWLVLFIITVRSGILKLIRIIKRKEKVKQSMFNKVLGRLVFLITIFIIGYFTSTPPNAPFLMDFPLTKPILSIVAVLILMYVWKFVSLLIKNNLSEKKIQVISVRVLGIALIICCAISVYWTEIIWRTSDSYVEKIAQKTADSNIWVTPNLVAYEQLGKGLSDSYIEKKKQSHDLKYISSAVRDFWANYNDHPDHPTGHKFKVALGRIIEPGFRNQMDLMKKLIEKLHKKKVRLLAGSDTGLLWIFPGVSMHEELELLVSCGLSPYEALQTATSNPADYFNIPNEIGRIKVDARADFILLNNNPLENIQNTRSIDGVMVRGEWLGRNRLENLKSELLELRK